VSMSPMNLAILAITPNGADLARRLGTLLSGVEVWLPERFRTDDACRYYREPLNVRIATLFEQFEGLICIMATGIVVRLLAQHLRGKQHDPAVVVLDEAGQFAISLLSGHLGGANSLAEEIGHALGATPVITTATDVNQLCAWDEAARTAGLLVEPVSHIKHLNRMLLEGERVALVDPERRMDTHYADNRRVVTCQSRQDALECQPHGIVWVGRDQIPGLKDEPHWLALRPRDLVVGIGCNRDTSTAEIARAVDVTLADAGLSTASLCSVASIDAKRDEVGLLDFATGRELPIVFYSSADLNEVDVPGTPSPYVLAAVGAKGVCEPAAVLAAGSGPLLVPKRKLGNVTVAVAQKVES